MSPVFVIGSALCDCGRDNQTYCSMVPQRDGDLGCPRITEDNIDGMRLARDISGECAGPPIDYDQAIAILAGASPLDEVEAPCISPFDEAA